MAEHYVKDITVTLTPAESLLVLFVLSEKRNYNPKDRPLADRVRKKIYEKVEECDNND